MIQFWHAAQEAADCGKKEGVGFALTMESGITAIDLDNCIDPEDDLVEDWATNIVLMMDTYTEVSPSGKGFRLFVRGTIPADHLANGQQGRKKQDIEIYGGLRYVTVTGEHYHGTPTTVESRQDELAALCGKYFDKPADRKESVPNPGNGKGKPTEAQLVALKKHKKFTDTWHRKRTDLPDQSASSYDLALANMAVEAGFTDAGVAWLIELWREEQGEDTDKLNRPRLPGEHHQQGTQQATGRGSHNAYQ